MTNADTANNAQGSQGNVVNAPTQTAPDKSKQTTPQAHESAATRDPLMDALGIPADVQAQLRPAASAEPEPSGDVTPETSGEEKEETTTEEPAPEEELPQTTPTDEPEEEEEPVAHKQDKIQKRINRLTKQKHELFQKLGLDPEQATITDAFAKIEELTSGDPGGRQSQATATDEPSIPIGAGPLSHINSESQLGQEVTRCNGIIQWCNENAEGVTTTDAKGEEKFITPKEIDQWRRSAEFAVLNAPIRLDQIRNFNADQAKFDTLAKQAWPELFDKRTKEHQLAQAILKERPWMKGSPDMNYAIGLVIEGMKSVQGRVRKAQGNGETARRGDIDPRVFGPRAPIAPHTPEPPSREPVDRSSSAKEFNQAMSDLIKDPDGSVSSLAKVFDAEDKLRTRGQPASGRTPVKV